MFSTGRAKRKVTIQTPTESRDATYNQKVTGWTNVATVWAQYESGGKNLNSENPEGNKVTPTRRVRFWVRYSTTLASINEKDRVVMGTDCYEISDLFPNKEDGFIRLDTELKGATTTT